MSSDEPALVLRADDVPLEVAAELGQVVVEVVGEKRSTRRRWNLHAEVSRQTMGWQFASTRDREAIVGMVADAAENASLRLTPPDLAPAPPRSVVSMGPGPACSGPSTARVLLGATRRRGGPAARPLPPL